jgi:hypothetical protein
MRIREIRKAMPGVVQFFTLEENVLYVKTRGNSWAPVPLGWLVAADGEYAAILEPDA